MLSRLDPEEPGNHHGIAEGPFLLYTLPLLQQQAGMGFDKKSTPPNFVLFSLSPAGCLPTIPSSSCCYLLSPRRLPAPSAATTPPPASPTCGPASGGCSTTPTRGTSGTRTPTTSSGRSRATGWTPGGPTRFFFKYTYCHDKTRLCKIGTLTRHGFLDNFLILQDSQISWREIYMIFECLNLNL